LGWVGWVGLGGLTRVVGLCGGGVGWVWFRVRVWSCFTFSASVRPGVSR